MFDIAVIGAGLAGLSTAVRASQLGCQVVVLEQGSGEYYPCNSRYAGGYFHLAFHDPAMEVEELISSLRQKAPADVNFNLIETIARNARRNLVWLQDIAGARFIWGGTERWQKRLIAPPRPQRTSLVWLGRGPDVLLRRLIDVAAAQGVTILLGSKVTALTKSHLYTVSHRATDETRTIQARAIVLADGGYQANLRYVRDRIIGGEPGVLQRNAGTGLGSGIAFAQQLGARSTDFDSFYGHLLSRDASHNDKLWPYPMVDPLAVAGVLLGSDGRRLVDEGRGGVFIANALARSADPLRAVVVFDSRIWNTIGKAGRLPCNPLLPALGGTIYESATLKGLAEAVRIDPASLEQTIASYNAALAGDRLIELVPTRTNAGPSHLPIVVAPFYAIPVAAGITHTMGGIVIDESGAVCGQAQPLIAGLFAAGSTVGGIEGGTNAFYLGGLCKAAVLGMICGESAAAYVGRNIGVVGPSDLLVNNTVMRPRA